MIHRVEVVPTSLFNLVNSEIPVKSSRYLAVSNVLKRNECPSFLKASNTGCK